MSLVPAAQASGALEQWTPEQVDLIKQQICPGASDDELAFFAHVCRHRGLDPFEGEITGIMRWNQKAGRNELKVQVTVEGLRSLAQLTGLYAGQSEPLWAGPDGTWRDLWLDKGPPVAAKVEVYRSDWAAPAVGKAHYSEFVQLDSKGNPTSMWRKMPANQLAKCAERQALIRAFKREMRALGVDVADLAPASRLSLEARDAGLDDDGRHALIHEVTVGRTDSSRDLTEQERLAARAEIARRAAPPTPAPQTTGVATQEEPPAPGDWYQQNGWAGRAEHTAYRRDINQRVKKAPDDQQTAWKAWLEANGIPADGQAHTKEQSELVAACILDIITPPPPGGTSVIHDLYAKFQDRLDNLTDWDRGELAKAGLAEGIDVAANISTLKQDEVTWANQWLDDWFQGAGAPF